MPGRDASSGKWYLPSLLIVGLLAALVVLLIGYGGLSLIRGARGAAEEEVEVGTAAGNRAPEVALKDMSGGTVYLSEYRGRIVLLNFRTTWCGYCRAEVPELQAAHDSLNDLAVVGVNIMEDRDTVQRYVDELDITFTMLLDETGDAAQTYGVRGIPTSFVLDRQGRVVGQAIGPMTVERIRSFMEQAP